MLGVHEPTMRGTGRSVNARLYTMQDGAQRRRELEQIAWNLE
jgi:hypothetical protein